jgi:hypothetical protein
MTSNPPPSSAKRGADLLNAARKNFRHSSPPREPPKTGNGKLPRVSKVKSFTEPRQPLRRFGLADYEIPEGSPEKGHFTLPERVNHKPLKILKKKNVQQSVHSGASVSSSDLPEASQHETHNVNEQPTAERDSSLLSSPPQMDSELDRADDEEEQSASETYHDDVQIEEHLPNVDMRCSAVTYKEGTGYEQCGRKGSHPTNDGCRCTLHLGRPGRGRCKHVLSHNGHALRCTKPEAGETGRCVKHATVEEPMRSEQLDDNQSPSWTSAKRKSVEALDPQGSARKSRRIQKHTGPGQEAEEIAQPSKPKRGRPKKTTVNSNPKVQIPVRKSNKITSSANETHQPPQDPVAASIEEAEPTQSTSGRQKQSKDKIGTKTAATKSKKVPKSTNASSAATSLRHEPQDGAEEDDDEEHSVDEAPVAKHPPGTVERVFEFLDLDDREGGCQTKLGITINRVCTKTASHLQGGDLAIEEVADNIDDVREVLKQVGEAGNDEEEDCVALKADMFGYVFRSLTLVLESLYECLRDMDENFRQSFAAMRIITPLMRDILGLKQTIAGWKVKTTQRYQGDRIIRDVDSHLIVPLREVYTIYLNSLSQLKSKELLRRQAAHIAREAEEQAEEFARQIEEEATRKQRWKRWQDLHITRLKCEPDPLRRRNLVITKLEELEERDANGIKIERLQVFKHRSNPPRSWASQRAQDVPWSDEETLALIRGLETFAGKSRCGGDESVTDAMNRPGRVSQHFWSVLWRRRVVA